VRERLKAQSTAGKTALSTRALNTSRSFSAHRTDQIISAFTENEGKKEFNLKSPKRGTDALKDSLEKKEKKKKGEIKRGKGRRGEGRVSMG